MRQHNRCNIYKKNWSQQLRMTTQTNAFLCANVMYCDHSWCAWATILETHTYRLENLCWTSYEQYINSKSHLAIQSRNSNILFVQCSIFSILRSYPSQETHHLLYVRPESLWGNLEARDRFCGILELDYAFSVWNSGKKKRNGKKIFLQLE